MTLSLDDLNQFTGTEYYHSLSHVNFYFTDGIKHVVTEGKAYWLIELINHAQSLRKVHQEAFQLWTLKTQNNQGVLTCEDGDSQVVYSRELSYTDFPLPELKIYLVDNILLLPSEY